MAVSSESKEAASAVKWYDFNTGFAKAQAEGKVAVIDCYTDWCGWCKRMDKNTFGNDSIARRMNSDFVAIKFNPEKPGKYFTGSDSLNGKQLLLALSNNKPSGYPTFFFFIPKTRQMLQVAGYQDAKKFGELLTSVEAMNISN